MATIKTIEVPALVGDTAWMLHPVKYGDVKKCDECGGTGKIKSPSGKQSFRCGECNGTGWSYKGDTYTVYYTTPVVCTFLQVTWWEHDESGPEHNLSWCQAFSDGSNSVQPEPEESVGIFESEIEAIEHAIEHRLMWAVCLESKRPEWARITPEVEAVRHLSWTPKAGTLKY